MTHLCKIVLAWCWGWVITASAAATSNATVTSNITSKWMTVIEKAGKLQQTTSGFANHFVLVISDINRTTNIEKCKKDAKNMDKYLDELMNGDGHMIAPARDISRVVSTSLDDLEILWGSYQKYAKEELKKDWSDKSVDKRDSFTKNYKFFTQVLAICDGVLDTYVNAATVETKSSAMRVVAYAARQVALADAVSSLLVTQSFSLDKRNSIRPLLSKFGNSHNLIKFGDPLQNINSLGDMCKLYVMREVSYLWEHVRSEITSILNENNLDEMYERTLAWRNIGVDELFQVRSLMYQVEKLFMEDTDACDPAQGIPLKQWSTLINRAGKQRMLSQKSLRLMLNVKAGVLAAESKIDLVVTLDSANSNLDELMFGSKTKGVPSPVSGNVASAFSEARAIWLSIEPDIRQVVVNNDVSDLVVQRVALMSETLLQKLIDVAQFFVNAAIVRQPTLGATVIDRSGSQRMLMQKMSKEAMLVHVGVQKEKHRKMMHETMLTWRHSHYSLLRGGENKSNTSTGVPKTTSICLLQQMQTAFEIYQELESTAIELIETDVGAEELHNLNGPAFAEMNKAVGMYGTIGHISCTERVLDNENLIKLLYEAGQLALLMEKVQKEFLQKSPTMHSTLTQISDSIDRLVYGNVNISAPLTQNIADELFDLEAKWSRVRDALNDSSAEITSESVRGQTTNITAIEMNALVSKFNELQKNEPSTKEIPVEMINLANPQRALLERMAKEALLASERDDDDAQKTLISSTGLYEKTNEDLLLQTHAGMTGAASKMAAAETEWTTYKALLLSVSAGDGGQIGKREMQESLARLSVIWEEILVLYSTRVPVPENKDTSNFVLIQVFVPTALICIPLLGGAARGLFS